MNNETSAQPHLASFESDEIRIYVVTHINEAIENGWIVPYYQPVVRTITGKLCGLEALARWDDPVRGTLAPDKFISALEESRLIHLLDCEIIRQVCRQYRECVNRGEPVVPISFNLSRLDFDLCDMFSVVESTAHEFEIPRRMLNIEITETVLGTDPEYMTAVMRKFHEAGYQVWMDDFGSGYSTLNALKDFDFDELKIDMEFLNRFGEKSKTILASVVDMAKKLGIQTLAEGVETEEHREYLLRIGCEKMQGFLFGKPLPYSSPELKELCETIGVETTDERLYLNEVGAVNTLSLSERDLTPGNSTQGYVTSMSLATVEFDDDTFKIISSNRVFREGLANTGISSIAEAENRINDIRRPLARHARKLVETIEHDKFARLDYVSGNFACVLRAKYITSGNGKIALLVSIDDTIEQHERRRHDRMEDVLTVMYSVYEHVDVIHLGDQFIEPVFGNIGLRAQFEVKEFHEITDRFANAEVYPLDRQRYREFMDHDTMLERINESGDNFISEFFRLRQHGGEYAWKMFGLIRIPNVDDAQVLLCIRRTHWSHDGLLQAAYDDNFNERSHDIRTADLTMTDGSLWRAIARDNHINLFWKDSNRRFAGANQAFLDYYGFDSVDDIVGKTDEDMGWHIDPRPFRNAEQLVLSEGAVVKDAMGQCIVQGEMRNIIANKRPVYRNGHIVGLVGYFRDLDEQRRENDRMSKLPTRDGITGVLNFTGLEAATWQFVDAYRRQNIDFAMISINVENFQTINSEFGYAFGEKVLKRVANELTDIAGNRRVIGHVYADRFVILSQNDTDDDLQTLSDAIEQRLLAISEVDGTSCTVYAISGFSRFSELGDVEAMKRYNRDRRLERRSNWAGSSNDGDIISSTLL